MKPTITVVGPDIHVTGARATWFGGNSDPEDNGETSSGFSTKAHPDAPGCALSMETPGFAPTAGSGIPKVPWLTVIKVSRNSQWKEIEVALIDLGPNVEIYPENYLDLTKPAFLALGGDLDAGSMIVDYIIPGAAKYLPQHAQ